ncbi:MAG: hypothetical protein P1V51_15680 [Deltaproteobacteria bacterium]|nr:hypothetical protein [Deltaproteobacteria bacterium]
MAGTIECPGCGETYNVVHRKPGRVFVCHCGRTLRRPVEPEERWWRPPPWVRQNAALWVALFLIGGFLLVIALPNFMHFCARSKQSEAKSNLKSLWLAQLVHPREFGRFDDDLERIGFSPERGNRYAYFGSAIGPVQYRLEGDRPPRGAHTIVSVDTFKYVTKEALPSLGASGCPITTGFDPEGRPIDLGASGEGDEARYLAYAIGDLDNDPAYDC